MLAPGWLQLLAGQPELLLWLTADANQKLQQARPKLERPRAGLEQGLKEVKTMAKEQLRLASNAIATR